MHNFIRKDGVLWRMLSRGADAMKVTHKIKKTASAKVPKDKQERLPRQFQTQEAQAPAKFQAEIERAADLHRKIEASAIEAAAKLTSAAKKRLGRQLATQILKGWLWPGWPGRTPGRSRPTLVTILETVLACAWLRFARLHVSRAPFQTRGCTTVAFGRFAARAMVALQLLVQEAPAVADEVEPVRPQSGWLKPSLTYDGTGLDDLVGGARTGSTYVGNLHLKLTAQGEGIGWPGTSAFIDVLTIHGGHPSSLVGDAQGVSNLQGPTGTHVEELWLQHNFKDSGVSLLAGIYDMNSEFYRLTAAGLFLNGSFGIGPEFAQSGVEGPSIFPRTSLGFRFAFKPTSGMVVRTAVLDGVPVVRPDGSSAAFRRGDGLLYVTELAMVTRDGTGLEGGSSTRDRIGRFSSLAPYDDKLALGFWRYSSRLADPSDTDPRGDPQLRRGSSGAYAIGEHLLVGGNASSGKRLAVFAQAGIADPRTNRFGSYLGAGIVASGWGLVQEADQFGASIARATNGSHYMRIPTTQSLTKAETTIELSYLTRVSKNLTLQPDLQYVVRPNTSASIANALVLQLRVEVAF